METIDLVERLRALAAEIDEDWAADNQPVSQGGPRCDGDPCSPRPTNTPADAADTIAALQARVEKLEGLAKRALEALDRATCSIENHSRRDEARRQADEIRAALAEGGPHE